MNKILYIISSLLITFNFAAAVDKKIYFYNWSEYLPQSIIKMFEKETGFQVIYSTFESNEVLYAKMKLLNNSKENTYDIVVPSSYYLSKMIKENMLAPLDHKKLENVKNLSKKLLNKNFDPNNLYSLPYMWGATVLTYNSNMLKDNPPTAWKDLWRPELKKQVLLLNDYREVFFIALKVLGHSGNTRDPKKIAEAYRLLTQLRPNVRLFDSQSPKVSFLSGEVKMGPLWNGEYYMAKKEDANIKAIVPKEGLFFFMDNLAIPKNSRNKEGAHLLINFLLRPQIAKLIALEVGYATPNREALKLLPEKIVQNPLLYPTEKQVMAGEFQEDVGDALPLYEKYWEKLKGQ